eukprot:g40568.t1
MFALWLALLWLSAALAAQVPARACLGSSCSGSTCLIYTLHADGTCQRFSLQDQAAYYVLTCHQDGSFTASWGMSCNSLTDPLAFPASSCLSSLAMEQLDLDVPLFAISVHCDNCRPAWDKGCGGRFDPDMLKILLMAGAASVGLIVLVAAGYDCRQRRRAAMMSLQQQSTCNEPLIVRQTYGQMDRQTFRPSFTSCLSLSRLPLRQASLRVAKKRQSYSYAGSECSKSKRLALQRLSLDSHHDREGNAPVIIAGDDFKYEAVLT